ncbi:MAG: stage II sporulation protein M [Holophaga sp.]
MKQERFERAHREEWAALEALLAGGARSRSGARLPAGDAGRAAAAGLPEAYRRACQHLALARERCYSAGLVQRLNALVLAGHQALYGSTLELGPQWGRFLAGGLARRTRALARPVLLAAALLVLPTAVLPMAIVRDPELAYVLEDPHDLARLETMYQPGAARAGRPGGAADDVAMFGFYIWNNVRISFQAFAGGILFGLGSVFYLVYNGVHGGVAAGHLVQAGLGRQFWPFVATHTALELPSLVLAGGAGLHLGWALLAPGRRTRARALLEAARDALPLVYGAALLDLGAACIEAFWSASPQVPPPVKLGTGAALWLLVAAYFLLAGRRRHA